MESSKKYLAIKDWAEEDRPREKLQLKGKSSLTNAELIAILLGSGSAKISAVDLSKFILSKYNNDLNALATLEVDDFIKFKGIGVAKAVTLVSALELARRRKEKDIKRKNAIHSASDAYEYIKADLLDQVHEQFWVLLLRRNNEVIRKELISKGGVSGTLVDPKIIFKKALDSLASSIILIHNHPSGNLKPSTADIRLTRKIQEAGELLEIGVLDHIIFTNESYFSFADEGQL